MSLIGLTRMTNPANVASCIVFSHTEENPTSSIVSDVRVKKTSPVLTEYFSRSSSVVSINPQHGLAVHNFDIHPHSLQMDNHAQKTHHFY